MKETKTAKNRERKKKQTKKKQKKAKKATFIHKEKTKNETKRNKN